MKEHIQALRPASMPCYDFINQGHKEKVTVIIVPITIQEKGDITRIAYACSRAKSCENETCRYSHKNTKNKFSYHTKT